MIRNFSLPTPPPQPETRGYPEFRNWLQTYGDRLLNYFYSWNGDLTTQFNNVLVGAGSDLASSTSITVTSSFHQVTGSAPISTINQPKGQAATSTLCLYARDGFTITTTGNITPAMEVFKGQCAILCYSPALNKWTGVTTLNLLEDDGGNIASASTITVSKAFYQVTGSTTINTINQAGTPPEVGPLCLYARDGFILGTSGNIATAMTVLPTRCAILFYSPTLSKWTGISMALLEGQGANIAASASIAITNMFHQITGSSTITTITAPTGWTNFALGPLVLYAAAGFLINTGGNIANAMAVQPQGIAVLFYSPTVTAWSGTTFSVGPRTALGGGAAATLGTVGGSGPTTAAQNSWTRLYDSSGATYWVPLWQ